MIVRLRAGGLRRSKTWEEYENLAVELAMNVDQLWMVRPTDRRTALPLSRQFSRVCVRSLCAPFADG